MTSIIIIIIVIFSTCAFEGSTFKQSFWPSKNNNNHDDDVFFFLNVLPLCQQIALAYVPSRPSTPPLHFLPNKFFSTRFRAFNKQTKKQRNIDFSSSLPFPQPRKSFFSRVKISHRFIISSHRDDDFKISFHYKQSKRRLEKLVTKPNKRTKRNSWTPFLFTQKLLLLF